MWDILSAKHMVCQCVAKITIYLEIEARKKENYDDFIPKFCFLWDRNISKKFSLPNSLPKPDPVVAENFRSCVPPHLENF